MADITADNWLQRAEIARAAMSLATQEYERIKGLRNDLIIAADRAGKTREQLAEMFGMSPSAIYMVLRKRGRVGDGRTDLPAAFPMYNSIIHHYDQLRSLKETAKFLDVPEAIVLLCVGHYERSTGRIMKERINDGCAVYDGGDQAGD